MPGHASSSESSLSNRSGPRAGAARALGSDITAAGRGRNPGLPEDFPGARARPWLRPGAGSPIRRASAEPHADPTRAVVQVYSRPSASIECATASPTAPTVTKTLTDILVVAAQLVPHTMTATEAVTMSSPPARRPEPACRLPAYQIVSSEKVSAARKP